MNSGSDIRARGETGEAFDDGSFREAGRCSRFVRKSPRRVDPDLAGEIAAHFLAARSNHTNATVRAAYDQLERQSDAIFTRLTNPHRPFHGGLRVEFTRCESPYDSDDELVGAVRARQGAGDHHERQGTGPATPTAGLRPRWRLRQISSCPRSRRACGPVPRLRPRRGVRGLADSGATLRRTRPVGAGHRAPRGAQRPVDDGHALRAQGSTSRP